jgi:hypothetical protein
MPFPLLALVPPLIAWGTRAVAAYGLARLFSEEPVQELKRLIYSHVVEYAAHYAGLNLDPDDPISDASFSAAVSERVGFQIRTLKDRAMIEEDLEGFALQLIEQRSGYHLSSLRDVEALKGDVKRIGLQYVSAQVGIPLTGLEGDITPDVIKGQLLAWGKAQLLAHIGEESGVLVEEIVTAGGLEAVAQSLNSRLAAMGSREVVTARQFALKMAGNMATKAVEEYGKVAIVLDKKSRRRELNRSYQAKFRRNHGNRQKYVPLDYNVTITKTIPGV